MPSKKLNRRQFFSKSAAGAASLALASIASKPSRVLGANDRISIGVIGCGGRGQYLMGEANKFTEKLNVEINTLCDVWRINRERAAAKVRNLIKFGFIVSASVLVR